MAGGPISGLGSLAIAGLTSLVLLSAGWVGGEVLVFHSGIAVRAAGNGALAPPVRSRDTDAVSPKNLRDAMGQLRGHWAAVQTGVAEMIVQGNRATKTSPGLLAQRGLWVPSQSGSQRSMNGATRRRARAGTRAPIAVAQAADREAEDSAKREFAQGIAAMGSVLDLQTQSVLEHAR